MKLHSVALHTDGESVRLIGDVERRTTGDRVEVYFRFPLRYRDFVDESADAFAIAMLVPSMRAREPLEVVPPVSAEVKFNLARVQRLVNLWYPEFQRVPLEMETREDGSSPRPPRAASFFSGGLDSFYTLLKYTKGECLPVPLTHIIMMRGVETKLPEIRDVEASEEWSAETAEALGVQPIFGETNIRSVFGLHWENYYFGSGLSATAYALARGFSYVCIPSSLGYRSLIPHGSSPLLDELYTSPHLRIVHDGADMSRPDKLEQALAWAPDLVLRHLRVCIRNNGAARNCGRCYKCVRTSVALAALGRLGEAVTFPVKSSAHWRWVMLQDHPELVEENLEFARRHQADRALVRMLSGAVRWNRRLHALRALLRQSRVRPLRSVAKRVLKLPRKWRARRRARA